VPDDESLANSSGPERRFGLPDLPENVVETGIVSFFADVSSEMLYPLTPIFLTTILGAPVAVVGLIEGIAEAIASLVKPIAGRLSDRSGERVPFMLWGYSLAALGKPLIALAQTWPVVLVARSVDRLGKGIRTGPRDAFLADSCDESERGKAFGWHRALDTAGAVVGALVSLLLLWLTHGNLRLVIWLAFIPGMVSVLFITRLRDTPPACGPDDAPRPPPTQPAIPAEQTAEQPARAPLGTKFRWYLAAWGIFALGNSSDAFIILRAKSAGLGSTAVVLLYVLYNVVYAVASPRLGVLSDRLGRRRVLVGGLLVFAAVYAGFAMVASVWQLVVLFAVYGVYVAATEGVGKALAIDLAPDDARASAVGMLGLVVGVATLLASIMAGVLWTAVGPWAAFALGMAGALVAVGLLLAVPALRHV
jgi:MFS family permease